MRGRSASTDRGSSCSVTEQGRARRIVALRTRRFIQGNPMSRFTLVSALVLSVVSAGLAQTGSPTVVRPPSVVASPPDGWWIRVDPHATTATRIDWQFGTTAKTLDVKNSWVRGGPDDLRISPPLQSGKALYIR